MEYKVDRQKALPITYNEVKLDAGYRIDLLVDDLIIVELKSVEELMLIHKAQLMTYFEVVGDKTWITDQFLMFGILSKESKEL